MSYDKIFEISRESAPESAEIDYMWEGLEPRHYGNVEKFWPYWAGTMVSLAEFERLIHRKVPTNQQILVHGVTECLKYEQPTYFLTKELGQALLRTTIPDDMPIEEFKLPFPIFRVVLERGTFVTGNTEFCTVLFGRAGNFQLPEFLQKRYGTIANYGFSERWLTLGVGVQPVAADSTFNHEGMEPFHTGNSIPCDCVRKVSDIVTTATDAKVITASLDLEAPVAKDPTSEDLQKLMINLTMFLMAKPEYTSDSIRTRKGKMKGQRKIRDMWSPRIVGANYKVKSVTIPGEHTPSGIKQPPHWRAGHWRAQPYGPNKSLRMRIPIAPYRVNFEQ